MTQANNPLHGIKLETLLNDLVDHYGWEELGQRIDIRCFNHDPSIKSSLKFLRKTPWAREKVEYLYLKMNKLPLPKLKPQSERPAASAVNSGDKDASSVNANIWGKSE
ncbi:VF530 family protein [Shewanella colwelliana]|uniref:Transporter n=1 Tax=Shewanella colwelliana TaxID=23 RepID=A0A1E5IZR1_SHECO|nr:VF530 family protein [Shewanella colwelliana]MDX1282173.1 VF530 family protein [Shewanella colwelliana]OEG75283.1 hypothetical protein BEL05_08720 [Shewanella colwelliana]GIU36393.1 hypothetical protein TUM3794_05480 [Shewanella colwelliana]